MAVVPAAIVWTGQKPSEPGSTAVMATPPDDAFVMLTEATRTVTEFAAPVVPGNLAEFVMTNG